MTSLVSNLVERAIRHIQSIPKNKTRNIPGQKSKQLQHEQMVAQHQPPGHAQASFDRGSLNWKNCHSYIWKWNGSSQGKGTIIHCLLLVYFLFYYNVTNWTTGAASSPNIIISNRIRICTNYPTLLQQFTGVKWLNVGPCCSASHNHHRLCYSPTINQIFCYFFFASGAPLSEL